MFVTLLGRLEPWPTSLLGSAKYKLKEIDNDIMAHWLVGLLACWLIGLIFAYTFFSAGVFDSSIFEARNFFPFLAVLIRHGVRTASRFVVVVSFSHFC